MIHINKISELWCKVKWGVNFFWTIDIISNFRKECATVVNWALMVPSNFLGWTPHFCKFLVIQWCKKYLTLCTYNFKIEISTSEEIRICLRYVFATVCNDFSLNLDRTMNQKRQPSFALRYIHPRYYLTDNEINEYFKKLLSISEKWNHFSTSKVRVNTEKGWKPLFCQRMVHCISKFGDQNSFLVYSKLHVAIISY